MKYDSPQNIEMSVELYRNPSDGWEQNLLIINGGNHHHAFGKISGNDEPHIITWTLAGNAGDGEFCALDDANNPGFTWLVRPPSEKIFRQIHHLGKTITMQNHHHDTHSEGVWHYQLFARFGEKIYGVPLTFTCGMSNPNPTIKNT
ncbi:MAG TPA: hypothetical protein VL997_15350 [Dyella sp.]|nr:hypothetical protein [Dyella sp.]